jgi:hypothetical protein
MGSCQVIYVQRTNQRANQPYLEVLDVKIFNTHGQMHFQQF